MSTETERLRIGLIGANGRWGPSAHIPAIQHLSQTELYAVCTAHEDTARAAAEKYSVEMAYWDDADMLANTQVEAVAVIVRVPIHYELTMNALRAGKHVYCEWPLGANLKEAQEIADLARTAGVQTMVGLQARSSPGHLRLKELVDEGYVGEVLSAHLYIINDGVLTRTSDRTWQREVAAGANPMTIPFGHAVDALCMCLGEFADVSATVSTQVDKWYETDTEKYVDVTSPDSVLVNGRLQSGVVVTASMLNVPYHASGMRMEVFGREGTLVLTSAGSGQTGGVKLLGGRKDDRELQELDVPERQTWVPQGTPEGAPFNVAQMWARFANAIRTGQRTEPDFETALTRHKMLDAVQRSSDEGRRIVVGA